MILGTSKMGYRTSKLTTIKQLIKDVASFIIGAVISVSLVCFAVISIPLLIFRVGLKILAKCVRPDLSDMVGDQNVLFLGDYFAATPPRCNVLLTLVLQGEMTVTTVKSLVLKNWIQARNATTGKLKYDRFQQYPVKWLGFVFWKWAEDEFILDNHIKDLFPGQEIVPEDQVTEAVEHLLNSRLPERHSPWEMHIVQNYQVIRKSSISSSSQNDDPLTSIPPHAAIILKFHHCLTDGYGIMTALVEGLCEHQSVVKMTQAADRLFLQSKKEKILYGITFPFRSFSELSQVLGHSFQKTPLKIPDHRKAWHQVLAKSKPIPIQRIKDIKNAFHVSFSSVLMSALSQALSRVLAESETLANKTIQDAVCLCMLPAPGLSKRQTVLTNHLTGALVNLPLNGCSSPEENLQKVFRNLEKSKKSVIPLGSPLCWKLLGAHVFSFYSRMSKNKAIPIYLSNFASVPVTVGPNKALTSVAVEAVAGGCEGETGLVITVVSYDQEIRIQVTAERALMSREETQKFVSYITDEIHILHDIMLV